MAVSERRTSRSPRSSLSSRRIRHGAFLRWSDVPLSFLSDDDATPAAATSDASSATAQQPPRRTPAMHALDRTDGAPLAPLPDFLQCLRQQLKNESSPIVCSVTDRFEQGDATADRIKKKDRKDIRLSMEQKDILCDVMDRRPCST